MMDYMKKGYKDLKPELEDTKIHILKEPKLPVLEDTKLKRY